MSNGLMKFIIVNSKFNKVCRQRRERERENEKRQSDKRNRI